MNVRKEAMGIRKDWYFGISFNGFMISEVMDGRNGGNEQ